MLLWKSHHLPADAYPRTSWPLVLPEIWSSDSQRSDLGRLFGRHGIVATHTNLNPRTVIPFDCHFEIMELLRWVYSNILCLYVLCCVLSQTHDLLSTMNLEMRFSCTTSNSSSQFFGVRQGSVWDTFKDKMDLWSTTEVPQEHNMPIFELQMCSSSKINNYKESAQVALSDVYTTQ